MDIRKIYSSDRDVYLRKLKKSLIDGNSDQEDVNYKWLLDEWKASIDASVPYALEALTYQHRDFRVFERVSTLTKYKFSFLDEFCQKRESALAELGCVICFLDSELAVYRAAGNESLRDELREKGIRHGTKFSVENVGVFVANIVKDISHTTVCRVGDENYLKVFTDYVCFARREEDPYRNFKGVVLIIAPKGLYTNFLKTEISFLLSVQDVSSYASFPFADRQRDLLHVAQYESNEIIMLLDGDGSVVFTSSAFEKEFGRGAGKGPYEHINTFMSEMVFITKSMHDGGGEALKEILLTNSEGKHHFYSVRYRTLAQDGKAMGIKAVLQPVKQKKVGAAKNLGQETKYTFANILGNNEKIEALKALGQQMSMSTSNVLIQGESGTGKELFAQSIHSSNISRNGPFVPINCASIPRELINSELFGYEGGAFTGALKGGHAGKFEQADGGTVFLDEVSEMPLGMQGSLLRVLEDRVISRIGGNRYIPLDVRVIAATNKDLWQCVQNGTFRADLYFRLNIVKLTIPPLRERVDDLEIFINHIVMELFEKGVCRCNIKFLPEVTDLFRAYSWPGNVRELKNVVERCVNTCKGDTIMLRAIPSDIIDLMSSGDMPSAQGMAKDWKSYNRERIETLMVKYNGNKSQVAKELGISRGTLYSKLREYGW